MTDAVFSPQKSISILDRLLAWRRAWLEIDRNREAIRYVQTLQGQIVLHAAVFTLIGLCVTRWTVCVLASVALTLIAISPRHRLHVLLLGTIGFLAIAPLRNESFKTVPGTIMDRFGLQGMSAEVINIATAFAFVIVSLVLLALQARFRGTAPARRPLISLMVIFWSLIGIAVSGLLPPWPQVVLWSFIAIFSSCFWSLVYASADLKAGDPTPNHLRIGLFRPMWGAPLMPIGKGTGYLSKFESKDDDALASLRLRALKLFVWALMLFWFEKAVRYALYDVAGLPTLAEAITAQSTGGAPAMAAGWGVVLTHYFLKVIVLCNTGHLVVAIIRMAGYGIPRNSTKPLAARSIAEFWNRYFFYFKELLVDFFFYPAFLRWFKSNKALRLAFATFFAAGVGNFLHHFMRRIDFLAYDGFMGALWNYSHYAIYCTVLSAGLIISQLRNRRPQPEDGFLRYEVLPRVNVALFFCLVAILDDTPVPVTYAERLSFFLSLFGVKV